jgi:hypothetical protein
LTLEDEAPAVFDENAERDVGFDAAQALDRGNGRLDIAGAAGCRDRIARLRGEGLGRGFFRRKIF